MSNVACAYDNDAERTFDVFFYGLNMDAGVLLSKGVTPRDARVAFIDGHMVKLGEKAMLLRSPKGRAYGMLFRLTHGEMDELYKGLDDYRAEPFQAVCANGRAVVAISMVHVSPHIHAQQDPEYSVRWNELVLKLGLPSINSSSSDI